MTTRDAPQSKHICRPGDKLKQIEEMPLDPTLTLVGIFLPFPGELQAMDDRNDPFPGKMAGPE